MKMKIQVLGFCYVVLRCPIKYSYGRQELTMALILTMAHKNFSFLISLHCLLACSCAHVFKCV